VRCHARKKIEYFYSCKKNLIFLKNNCRNILSNDYNAPMIPFSEIAARLEALGKNRAWLAQESGRKPDSVRVALAPNATESKRSELLQKALSDAIEREEAAQAIRPVLPDRLSLEPSKEEFNAWCRAYKASPQDTLDQWAIAQLNSAAREWQAAGNGGLVSMPTPQAPPSTTVKTA
jgi:hypothetical protein